MTNIGITGLGFMGMIHYLAYERTRGAKVKAICETQPDRLAGDWRSIKGNFGPQGKKMDLNKMIKTLRQHPESRKIGMIATHLGIVRGNSRGGGNVTHGLHLLRGTARNPGQTHFD